MPQIKPRISDLDTKKVYNLETSRPMEVIPFKSEEANRVIESSPYYKDTIQPWSENAMGPILSSSSILQKQMEESSLSLDEELKKPTRNFEKLQELVYKVLSMMMHRGKQADQEYSFEKTREIHLQAKDVQSTYNPWMGLSITVLSSLVSLGGGAAGISPLIVQSPTTQVLAQASQSIGTAGTGLSGVGSIFNSKSEGKRYVYQIILDETKKKREDREQAKQQKSTSKNEAMNQLKEITRENHQTAMQILSPNG